MRVRSFWHLSRFSFFCVDYVLLWVAVVGAFKLSPRYIYDIFSGIWLNDELRFVGYGLPLFMALGLQVSGMQRSQVGFRTSQVLAQTVIGIAGGMLVFAVIHATVEFSLIGRYVLGISLVCGTVLVSTSRLLVWKLADQQRRSVLVYGSAGSHAAVARQVALAHLPIQLIGHIRLDALRAAAATEMLNSSLFLYCERIKAEEVVIEVPGALLPTERDALLFCTGQGISVVELGYFFERELEKVYVQGLKESWFWGYDPAHIHPVYFATKRAIDVGISLLGLLAFIPLAPLLMLLIKLQDGGAIFYSQIRIGENNRPFRIYKLRTMRVDAEQGGPQWAKNKDNRVTRIGRWMRLTRIDEVPQFWNILLGDMSFIGPRPERPELVEAIESEVPYYRYRHLVKPGLTGWAQINYPYGASIEDAREKLAYDLYYMKYSSMARELHIALRTIVAMMRGAR